MAEFDLFDGTEFEASSNKKKKKKSEKDFDLFADTKFSDDYEPQQVKQPVDPYANLNPVEKLAVSTYENPVTNTIANTTKDFTRGALNTGSGLLQGITALNKINPLAPEGPAITEMAGNQLSELAKNKHLETPNTEIAEQIAQGNLGKAGQAFLDKPGSIFPTIGKYTTENLPMVLAAGASGGVSLYPQLAGESYNRLVSEHGIEPEKAAPLAIGEGIISGKLENIMGAVPVFKKLFTSEATKEMAKTEVKTLIQKGFSILGGSFKTAGEESLEESAQQITANIVDKIAGIETSPINGVPSSAAAGFLAGLGLGAGGHVLTEAQTPTKEFQEKEIERLPRAQYQKPQAQTKGLNIEDVVQDPYDQDKSPNTVDNIIEEQEYAGLEESEKLKQQLEQEQSEIDLLNEERNNIKSHIDNKYGNVGELRKSLTEGTVEESDKALLEDLIWVEEELFARDALDTFYSSETVSLEQVQNQKNFKKPAPSDGVYLENQFIDSPPDEGVEYVPVKGKPQRKRIPDEYRLYAENANQFNTYPGWRDYLKGELSESEYEEFRNELKQVGFSGLRNFYKNRQRVNPVPAEIPEFNYGSEKTLKSVQDAIQPEMDDFQEQDVVIDETAQKGAEIESIESNPYSDVIPDDELIGLLNDQNVSDQDIENLARERKNDKDKSKNVSGVQAEPQLQRPNSKTSQEQENERGGDNVVQGVPSIQNEKTQNKVQPSESDVSDKNQQLIDLLKQDEKLITRLKNSDKQNSIIDLERESKTKLAEKLAEDFSDKDSLELYRHFLDGGNLNKQNLGLVYNDLMEEINEDKLSTAKNNTAVNKEKSEQDREETVGEIIVGTVPPSKKQEAEREDISKNSENQENIGYNDKKTEGIEYGKTRQRQVSAPEQDSGKKPGISDEDAQTNDGEKQPDIDTGSGISGIRPSDRTGIRSEHRGIIEKEYKNQVELNKAIEDFVNSEEYKKYDKLPKEIKDFLKKYSGAGGLEKQGASGRGLLSEYYTPDNVVKKMWGIVRQYVETSEAKALEPSVGIGRFVEHAPAGIKFDSYEMNPVSAKIAELLYPGIDVNVGEFQEKFIDNKVNRPVKNVTPEYDIVIGNPPYGQYSGRYKGMGEGQGIAKIEEYFIKRGLDILKENGILVYIVPSSFLKGAYSTTKAKISNQAKLVDAYRLPEKMFDTTTIGTDIIVLRKEKDLTLSKRIINDNWFKESPEKILGQTETRKNRFGKEETYVKGDKTAVEKIDTSEKDIRETVKAKLETKKLEQKQQPQKTSAKKTTPEKSNIQTIEYTPYVPEQKISKEEYKLWADTQVDGTLPKNKYSPSKTVSQYKGELYNDFNYLQGDIYEKLEQLEKEDISEEQRSWQKKKLTEVLPKPKEVSEVEFTPTSDFTQEFSFGETKTEIYNYYKGENEVFTKQDTLAERFKEYIYEVSASERNGVSAYDLYDYIRGGRLQVKTYGNEEQKAAQKVDKLTKIKNTADKLFNDYINTQLTREEKQKLRSEWNRKFNNRYVPDFKKIPLMVKELNSEFYEKTLNLLDVQTEAINFMTNTGVGLFGAEVGVGKTLASIVATVQNMQMGRCKKPLILVPKQVKDNWIREIKELFPNMQVNDVGNLSKFNGEIKEGSLTVATYEALGNMWYDETLHKTEDGETFRTGQIRELIDELFRVGTDFNKSSTERGREQLKEDIEKMIGIAEKGNKKQFTINELGFDHITVDEAHNFRNLFRQAKAHGRDNNAYQSVGRGGNPSARAARLFLLVQHILKQNNNRNVFMATATPFNNSPLEVFNMLSFIAKDKLDKMGLYNVYQFMESYADMTADWVVDSDNNVAYSQVVKGFKNAGSLRNLIKSAMLIRSADDAGVQRPEKVVDKVVLEPSQGQLDLISKFEEEAVNSDEDGAILKKINQARATTLSPDIAENNLEVSPEEFVENSPKLEYVAKTVQTMKNQDPQTSQLIYFPLGLKFIPKLKQYFVDKGIFKADEVAVISSQVKDDKIPEITDSFNDPKGKVKLIIGTQKIKEGMNLNKNTSALYIPFIDWNPTDFIQIIGRVWRQGNAYEKVRIVTPLLKNSSDPFMFQKLDEKTSRINNIMDENKEYIDTGELNTAEEKLNMISLPDKKVKMFESIERQSISNRKAELEGRKETIEYYANEYEKAEDSKKWYKSEVEKFQEQKSKLSPEDEMEFNRLEKRLQANKKELKKTEKRLKGLDSILKRLDIDIKKQEKLIEDIDQELESLKKQEENLEETKKKKLADYEQQYKKQQASKKPLDDFVEEFKEAIKESTVRKKNTYLSIGEEYSKPKEVYLNKKAIEKLKNGEIESATVDEIVQDSVIKDVFADFKNIKVKKLTEKDIYTKKGAASKTHKEIAINIDKLSNEDIQNTLIHELTHIWQFNQDSLQIKLDDFIYKINKKYFKNYNLYKNNRLERHAREMVFLLNEIINGERDGKTFTDPKRSIAFAYNRSRHSLGERQRSEFNGRRGIQDSGKETSRDRRKRRGSIYIGEPSSWEEIKGRIVKTFNSAKEALAEFLKFSYNPGQYFIAKARGKAHIVKGQPQRQTGDDIYSQNINTQLDLEDANSLAARIKNSLIEFGKDSRLLYDRLFLPIDTRLHRISPMLQNKVRRFTFDLLQMTKKDDAVITPFLKKSKEMEMEDFLTFDLALKNGDVDKINEIVEKYGIQKEYNVVKGLLEELHDQAILAGIDVGFIDNYYPRMIKNNKLDAYLEYFEKLARQEEIDIKKQVLDPSEAKYSLIKKELKENDKYKNWNTEEKAKFINSKIRGFGKNNILLNRPGQLRSSRKIETLTPEMNLFYKPFTEALAHYVPTTRKSIEERQFFGGENENIRKLRNTLKQKKNTLYEVKKRTPGQAKGKEITRLNYEFYGLKAKLENNKNNPDEKIVEKIKERIEKMEKQIRYIKRAKPEKVKEIVLKRLVNDTRKTQEEIQEEILNNDEFNVENSIGAMVNNMVNEGVIYAKDERIVRELLLSKFNFGKVTGATAALRDLGYIGTLNDFGNTIVQFGDMGLAFYKNGFLDSVKGITERQKITREDLGLETIAEEFKTKTALSETVNKLFKIIGFDAIDSLGKNTLMNGYIAKAKRQAKLNSPELNKKLKTLFGKEAEQAKQDLINDKRTDRVLFLAFDSLADIQPITLDQLPEVYAKGGIYRLAYMLKTYTLKILDVVRRDVRMKITDGVKTKNKKLIVEGLKNLALLQFFMMLFGVPKDLVIDWLLGRDVDIPETVLDNILLFIVLNRYTIKKAGRDGIGSTFVDYVTPPTASMADTAVRDSKRIASGKANPKDVYFWNYIPVIGRPWYWRFGGGKTRAFKDKNSKRMHSAIDAYFKGDMKKYKKLKKEILDSGYYKDESTYLSTINGMITREINGELEKAAKDYLDGKMSQYNNKKKNVLEKYYNGNEDEYLADINNILDRMEEKEK